MPPRDKIEREAERSRRDRRDAFNAESFKGEFAETKSQQQDIVNQLDRMAAKAGRVRGRFGSSYDPKDDGQTLSFDEYLEVTQRTDQDPFGNEGRLFNNPFGALDYRDNMTPAQINARKRMAYDKYLNPFGDDGKLRPFRSDQLTRLGRTAPAPPRQGIAGLIDKAPNFIPLGSFLNFLSGTENVMIPGVIEEGNPNLQRGIFATSKAPSASGNIEESVIQKAAPENFETDAGDFFRQQYQFSEAPQINPDSQLAVNLSNRDGPYSLTDLILGAPGLGDQARNDFDEEFFKNYASDGQGGYTPINRATRQNLSGIADVAARLYGLKPLIDAPLGDNSFLTIEGRMLGGEPEGGIYFTKRLPPTR